jgi:Trypsin
LFFSLLIGNFEAIKVWRMKIAKAFVRGINHSLLVIITLTWVVWGSKTVVAQENCQDTPQGKICTATQPLTSGALVPVNEQKSLGLVSVGGGCSGTLLNRFWIITADHCVAKPDLMGNVSASVLGYLVGRQDTLLPQNVQITAAWSTRIVTPTSIVRRWRDTGRDVALIFLGNGDFGSEVPSQYLNGPVRDKQSMRKYGGGINAYATPAMGSAPARPAGFDGLYRTALFTAKEVGITYSLPANASGQVGNGGDSGGPDFIVNDKGERLGIGGVQSTCEPTSWVPGQPRTWTWTTAISKCNSVHLDPIREEMTRIISAPACPNVSAGCAVTETTSRLLLLK